MSATWKFYNQLATDPIHNPIAGEFFSTEAVGDVTEALIREGIQNTLDARIKKGDGARQTAQARIFLSDIAGALPANKARRWFSSIWPHVMAVGNGLRDQPAEKAVCPYLVFEDFGTIGLNGDPEEHRVTEGVVNHFLNFFRAEGHSDKGGEDRGSWGVGKTVFPRSSRISSFLGFTVRSDDGKQLLLGRSILKYHRVNGSAYKSDGYFGLPRNDGFMLPTGDPATLADFRSDFCIKRGNESGLSIVVPWYELDGDEGMTRDRVVSAVLRGFFYPILMGHLSVVIATPDEEIALDADSILRKVEAIGGSLALELLPMIMLAEWAQTRTESEFTLLAAPEPGFAQSWSAENVPAEVIKHIRMSISQRQPVALRVPMEVHRRDAEPQHTFFNIFLEHSNKDSEKPVFIRDELIISDVKSPRTSQVRSLVIVEDGPLATLLRDAETPAHTQWNQETSNFKNKYKFGASAIKFVRLSVTEILRIINQAEQQPDPTITIDYFSLPAPEEDSENIPAHRRKKMQQPEGEPPPVPPVLPRTPRRFRIDKLRGGFAIRAGDPDAPLPPSIEVRVAYDVRRGNSLKKYNKSDFDLAHTPVRYDFNLNGVRVTSAIGNQMLINVESPGFNLEVTGFDTDRDLYVKAEVKEVVDVD